MLAKLIVINFRMSSSITLGTYRFWVWCQKSCG